MVLECGKNLSMSYLLLDDLCEDWYFDVDNLEHILVKIDGVEYKKEILSEDNTCDSDYIIHGGNKYYFDYPV